MKNKFFNIIFCLFFVFWSGISCAEYNVAGNSSYVQNSQNQSSVTPQKWYNPKVWWNWYKKRGLVVQISIPTGMAAIAISGTIGTIGYAVYRYRLNRLTYNQQVVSNQSSNFVQSQNGEEQFDADRQLAIALSLEDHRDDPTIPSDNQSGVAPFLSHQIVLYGSSKDEQFEDDDLSPSLISSNEKKEIPIDSALDHWQMLLQNGPAELYNNAVTFYIAAQNDADRLESVGLYAQAAQSYYEYLLHLGEYKPSEMMAYTNATLLAISWHGITPENHDVVRSFTDRAIHEFTLRTVSQGEFTEYLQTLTRLYRLSAILSLQRLQQLTEDNPEYQTTLQKFKMAVYDETSARLSLVPTNANTVNNRRALRDLYAIQGNIDEAAHWLEPSSSETQRTELLSFNIHTTPPKELPALLQHFALPRAEEIDVNTELLLLPKS